MAVSIGFLSRKDDVQFELTALLSGSADGRAVGQFQIPCSVTKVAEESHLLLQR